MAKATKIKAAEESQEATFIPDVPAQMEDVIVEEPMLTEVEFLNHILYLQDIGGWGKHLHPVIKERIKNLQK